MKPFPYSKDDIKHAANGNWQGILTRMGVPQRALTNKHQPCPICGGKDRYRFDNKHGNGTYFCNQCGSGDGITFVMKWLQCSFPDALRAIAEQLGMTPATNRPISRIQPAPQHEKPEKDELTKLQHIWQETQPLANTPAEQYLRQRGLSLPIKTTALRYHAALPYWGRTIDTGEPIFMGNYGAMVSAITDLKGEMQGLHMTYINNAQKLKLAHPQTGELMPAKKMQNRFSGSLMGSAVHIDEISDTGFLMVAEGIETALAAKELFQSEKGVNLPVWACLDCHKMSKLVLPEIKTLFIIADHDTPRPIGYECAHTLAVRAIKSGIKVHLWQPTTQGFDALDELNALKGETA